LMFRSTRHGKRIRNMSIGPTDRVVVFAEI
jgi:hypothetical protein